MKPATPLPWAELPYKAGIREVPEVRVDDAYELHACNAYPRLVTAACEYILAADASVRGEPNDTAAMLRFGKADHDIRALLHELGEMK